MDLDVDRHQGTSQDICGFFFFPGITWANLRKSPVVAADAVHGTVASSFSYDGNCIFNHCLQQKQDIQQKAAAASTGFFGLSHLFQIPSLGLPYPIDRHLPSTVTPVF